MQAARPTKILDEPMLFFEVVIVASCNEYLSLPNKKKKKKKTYVL